MARRSATSQPDTRHNGQVPAGDAQEPEGAANAASLFGANVEPAPEKADEALAGDAHEPEGTADTSFDPAEFGETAAGDTPIGEEKPQAPAGRDLFDPEVLGLTQDFEAEASVAQQWDIIKVEKPSKSRVFRVHPTMRLRTMLLVLKEDNETYVVAPQLRRALANESLCGTYTLFPCVTKAGTPFLWPIRMAGSDGKWNDWHKSAWGIAEKARIRWTRMQANRDAGQYTAVHDQRPPEQQQEPAWPDMSLRDWLKLAFKDFAIDSLEHPVLRRLRVED
jgi:hypothetical protein